MREPNRPRNRDQVIPTRSGDDMGKREPLAPQSGPERQERRPPLPEEDTHEHGREDREEQRADEEKPPVED
jgi:hypothetical protein